MNIFKKQGKKEESLTIFNQPTLTPDLPTIKKGGGKGTEFFSLHSVSG